MKVLGKSFQTYLSLFGGVLFIFILLSLFTSTTRNKEFTSHFFDPSRITSGRQEIVVVGIDDKSLQSIGAWPWSRNVFASLHKELEEQGAAVVVYDILFLEKRIGDEDFEKALSQSKIKTILASKLDNNLYLESFLHKNATNTVQAIANIQADSDGKVRLLAQPYTKGDGCVETLSRKAFELYTKKSSACATQENTTFRHSYDIKTFSVVDVINKKIPEGALKNKVIFIGSVTVDLPDHFVSLSGEKVAGVYMHASMFSSLLKNQLDEEVSKALLLLIIALYMLLSAGAVLFIRKSVYQLLTLIGLLTSVLLISDILYQNHLIIAAPLILFSVILSALYTGIFRFLKERKQNEYIKNLFSRYVHKDVLQELLNSSSQVRLGGERREVSVLFSDLRGFTTFSEQMNAEELTTLLNDYLSAMSPIILEEKGTIDKYIGDAIMAFWNAPLPTKDHAKRAAKSALRMQEALNAFNKERNTTLAMGIGIHSGEVIVGNVGSLERINYTILGDVVNNTSRLEGITKKYGVGIIATEELKQKIDDPDILFRKLDVIIVKGKTKPTHIFEVLFFSKEKESLVHEYEEAFLLYQKGDFNKAKISFEKLEKVGDAPSAVMLERIAFLEKNTSKEWDGVWKFNEK